MKLCECGCRREIRWKSHYARYGISRFIPGHQSRGKKFPVREYPNYGFRNKQHSKEARRKNSINNGGTGILIEEIPIELCECGCSQMATQGHRFVQGHNKANLGKRYPKELYPNYGGRGKRCSEETKRKVSLANKGRKFPTELYPNKGTLNKRLPGVSESNRRRHCSKETRKKISEGSFKSLRTRRENYSYYFMRTPFDSKGERQAAIWQFFNWGVIPEERVNCHVRMNGGEIDFRPFGWLFLEYHPWDRRGLSKEDYFKGRRKLLDENGYKDCKLIVITALNKVENMSLL